MLTLGVDSATATLSVALVRDGQVLSERTSTSRRGQSEELLPLINDACIFADVKLSQVQQLAAITGPGSFTGIRIGLAAVQGLALGYTIPAFGVTSFVAARAAVPEAHVRVFESWREELFVQFGASAPEMLTPAQIIKRLQPDMKLTGDAAAHFPQHKFLPLPPLAAIAANLADTGEALIPFYLRPPDVTVPKTK
jgi:tRNA threonylcarbamoyladenosine biosynthesis protein TsaB